MKTYSIGRDINCDIVIDDSTDVISRRHALLNITPSGKMTIIDQSSNGTYVNGIRISQNVPVPITKKDTISFAHVAVLDWKRVPSQGVSPMKIIIFSIIGVIVTAAIAFGAFYMLKPGAGSGPGPIPADSDSIKTVKPICEKIDTLDKKKPNVENADKKKGRGKKTKGKDKDKDNNNQSNQQNNKPDNSERGSSMPLG
ncbi:MAG: FHA domain-containing protein [Muribaculaceae bacterium]|nr:FHA domain-containing protein [Muribaculaceae bacterium]